MAAGAGSGKTRTVIHRLLYLLGAPVEGRTIEKPVDLDRLAAVTYTVAAAAELKRKLRTALRAAGFTDLAWRVDTARIGTIHAFCGEILREFALRRGMSPGLTVLEDGESQAFMDEAARDAVVAAVEGKEPGMGELLVRYQQATIHEAIVQLIGESDRLGRIESPALPPDEQVLIAVARRALALLQERHRERGAVDFDRMLTWTRDLLRDDGYSRRTLQRRIHTLIVDEFQDVDPVQWEIARLLGDLESGRTDTPRLLLVGDAKQSIYRFRRADITVWREAERLLETRGKILPLNESFRSTAPVLDFVAATAGALLDQPIDPAAGRQEYEIEFARLEMGNPVLQGDGPAVELISVPQLGGGVDEIRRVEAVAIARRAMELHQEGVGWKDMALLFPAWGAAAVYQDALRSNGIPTYLLLDEGFFERREVLDQLVALQAVRDPTDDLALMGFLRSPFVGVRDETLLSLAFQGTRPTGTGCGIPSRLQRTPPGEQELLRRGVSLLKRAVALRDRIGNDELLADLLEQSGYWAHLALLGERRSRRLRISASSWRWWSQAESTLGELCEGSRRSGRVGIG